MNLETILYTKYLKGIPKEGQHILAQQSETELIVYMAFNDAIANYAIENQVFGGDDFSFNRMSWIKTNFLWMMHRSGWGSKENQNRILAIWIKRTDFEKILEQAVHSSYQADIYHNHENWQTALKTKKVRLQWDPNHSPHGNKEERKAIQLGLKDKILRLFATEMIVKIEDITDFVKAQKEILKTEGITKLLVAKEHVFIPNKTELQKTIAYK